MTRNRIAKYAGSERITRLRHEDYADQMGMPYERFWELVEHPYFIPKRDELLWLCTFFRISLLDILEFVPEKDTPGAYCLGRIFEAEILPKLQPKTMLDRALNQGTPKSLAV